MHTQAAQRASHSKRQAKPFCVLRDRVPKGTMREEEVIDETFKDKASFKETDEGSLIE